MTNTVVQSKAKAASKYSPAMEAELRALAETGLNADVASQFADKHNLTARSVIAKITRMELPYEKKVRTTKAGGKIESKEAIVAQIAELTGATLDGLEKAPKAALQAVRDYVLAHAA